MAGGNKKVSITLTNGVDNRTLDEFIGPVAAQGQSPKLKASTNTRLSARPGTCVRAAKVTSTRSLTAGTKITAVVPGAAGRVTNLANQFYGTGQVVRDDGTDSSGSGTVPGVYSGVLQSCQARVSSAGADDGFEHIGYAASAYSSTAELVYRAYLYVPLGTGAGATVVPCVSAWTLDGEKVAAGESAATFGIAVATVPWVALTTHGASGVRLWWHVDAVGIRTAPVTISGAVLTVGTATTIALPGQAAGIDIVSTGGDHVYLIHATVGSVTNATVRRIDVTTNTTTHTATLTNTLDGGGKVALQYATVNGSARLLAVTSEVTGATTHITLYDSTLAVVGATQTVALHGYVSCGFYDDGTSRYAKVYVSTYNENFLGTYSTANANGDRMGTREYHVSLAAWGAFSTVTTYVWDIMQSHVAQWAPAGTTQLYPILLLGRALGSTNYLSGQTNYLDDPSHYALLGSNFHGVNSIVARYGVLRGELAPAQTWPEYVFAGRQSFVANDVLHVAWKRQSRLSYALSRFIAVDLTAKPLPIAHDKDGTAMIAGAAPQQWDSIRMSPIGSPMYGPKIYVAKVAGALAAGTYRFAVVLEWSDRTGTKHRSRPSNVVSVALNGAENVTVYGTSTGQPLSVGGMAAVVYMSVANGTSLHETTRLYASNTTWNNATALTAVTGAEPQIYSTGSSGEERPPQPPPPARDIAIVGPRAWVIDAEEPSRLAPSKLRVAGYGYEWDPNLAVVLPSEAGDGYAVREWGGFAVALCENGAYQITGDGPSNAIGDSGAFSPPIKISDIGCNNTCSVVRFPGGIIWQYRNRFALMTGAGIGYIEDFKCEYDVSQAFCVPRHEEILFFSSAVAEVRVFNYARQAWTTWDSQVLPAAPTLAAQLPWDRDTILFYVQSSGTLYRMEAELVSTCTNMVWETDWLLLGADFHDHGILKEIVFNGLIVGPHSITLEVYFDYAASLTTGDSATWSSAELDAIDTAGRYSVRFEPRNDAARVAKIKVYDTVGVAEVVRDGVAPRSLTLVYTNEQTDTLLYEDAFVQGSRK